MEGKGYTEAEILAMAEKIRQNRQEDAEFAEKMDEFLNDTRGVIKQPITIGQTPTSLVIAGANPNLKITINVETIKKCMSTPEEHRHGHELSADIIKHLPSEIRSPAMIFRGRYEKSLVLITELKDKENRGIMVAIELSGRKGFREVNRVASAYGKDNLKNYLKAQILQGNLIAVNKEKADEMLHSMGLQSPHENTFISFDNSIAYSTGSIKYQKMENEQNEQKIGRKEAETEAANSPKDRSGRVQEKGRMVKKAKERRVKNKSLVGNLAEKNKSRNRKDSKSCDAATLRRKHNPKY